MSFKFLIGLLFFTLCLSSSSFVFCNTSKLSSEEFSIANAEDMLKLKYEEWLSYLLYSACFMFASFIIWALVRFCLVVPRQNKIKHLEQHYKLVKDEYKSERQLMASQKETSIEEPSTERSVLRTTSDISRWSDDPSFCPSSLKSDRMKIDKKKQQSMVPSKKTQSPPKPLRAPLPKLNKPESGPPLTSNSSNYEAIGDVDIDQIKKELSQGTLKPPSNDDEEDQIYSAPSTPKSPVLSIKSAKLFSEEMDDAVPFSMLSDGGRGHQAPPLSMMSRGQDKREIYDVGGMTPTTEGTEETTEEEKVSAEKVGSGEKVKTNTSSSTEEKEENEEDDIYKT